MEKEGQLDPDGAAASGIKKQFVKLQRDERSVYELAKVHKIEEERRNPLEVSMKKYIRLLKRTYKPKPEETSEARRSEMNRTEALKEGYKVTRKVRRACKRLEAEIRGAGNNPPNLPGSGETKLFEDLMRFERAERQLFQILKRQPTRELKPEIERFRELIASARCFDRASPCGCGTGGRREEAEAEQQGEDEAIERSLDGPNFNTVR